MRLALLATENPDEPLAVVTRLNQELIEGRGI